MRVRLLLGSFGLLALVVLVAPAALTACAASGGGSALPNDPADAATSPAASSLDGGKPSSGGADGGDSATPPPANDCKLPDIKNVANVTPTFAAPDAMPPVMTGGTLNGNYLVDTATVFLPSGIAGFVDTKKSTGTVNAWAVFSGTNYRLSLNANFVVSVGGGTQSQGANTASQGAFMVSGAAITLDHACDTTLAQEAQYSFTDTGTGRATILIKLTSTYGDTYLQLDAAKN